VKKGLMWGGALLLAGGWTAVIVNEFLHNESVLRKKDVKAALVEQKRCEGRYLKFRSYEQFRARLKVPFVSDLAPERWAEQFSSLRDGMREHEVEKILGAPDYARCNLSKEGDRFVGSKWQYEISVPQDLANDSQNNAIEILFGPDGKLKEKNAANMQSKPNPVAVPSPVSAPVVVPLSTSTPAPAVTREPSAMPATSSTPTAEATPH